MKPFTSCLAAVAFLLLARGAAGACVCVTTGAPPTPEEARAALVKDYNRALAVFSGRVVALDTFKVTFKLDRVWKGEFGGELVMSTGAKDNGDGTSTSTSCDFDFALGEEYLVFAYGGEPGEEMRAHQCTRTAPLKGGARDVQELDEVWPHEKRNAPPRDPADPQHF